MPFDFSQIGVPFRMQPGLRRIAPGSAQLTPALPNSRHLREKSAVLSATADEALVSMPGFDPEPAFRAVAEEAMRSEPLAFRHETDGSCQAPLLGWSVAGDRVLGDGDPAIGALLSALPLPRRRAALLSLAFEEDFAVIDGATARIPWLAVCLPSRWAPAGKVGRHFAEVHAPVADNALLIGAADGLARLVTGNDRWERTVWTISADPRLHQHPARGDVRWPDDVDADGIAAVASFRHEHQTFIPIMSTGSAVFTIRVRSEPLTTAIAAPADAARLHAALESMSPAVLRYRGLDAVRDRLLEALARRAQAAA